jgi:ketosteroid isomerase-like protein
MKNIIKKDGLLLFATLIFSACSTPEKKETIDLEKIAVEIQAMEDAYAAAEKAGDADGVVAYYSDDAINYGANLEPASGKVAIREKIAKRLANDTLGNYNVYKIVDLFATGDTALELGSWIQFDSSGKEMENGNYMSYFEKRDGKYLCVRDMSTTTSPVKSGM